ncbi:MAG: acyl-[acyl-carrier-protein] desaturase [Actinomycetota bacterium]|jgi:acyl-[acyl-carrier-protein] desaturase|nr:acyl-[acyl-carrier-protein] desaturase [Actinomycetota bacterium]
MNETDLLHELAPEAERLLERHLSTSKEWFPHQLVPWDRAAKSDPRNPWDIEAHPMDEAVRQALFLNLLTEDNLPYYTSKIDSMFGGDHPWGAWNRRWTAEEGRHSIVIRDYLTLSGAIDPVALERARMQQVSHGFYQPIANAFEGLVYVALQELATRISHRNTGKRLAEYDPAGYEVMARVAADENLHYLFYRDASTAAVTLDPSSMVIAMERQVRDFEMPGAGVEGFRDLAKAIARAGIYDLQIHHDQILVPVIMRHWRLESLEGLTPEAEQARERLVARIAKIGRVGRRLAGDREEATASV